MKIKLFSTLLAPIASTFDAANTATKAMADLSQEWSDTVEANAKHRKDEREITDMERQDANKVARREALDRRLITEGEIEEKSVEAQIKRARIDIRITKKKLIAYSLSVEANITTMTSEQKTKAVENIKAMQESIKEAEKLSKMMDEATTESTVATTPDISNYMPK